MSWLDRHWGLVLGAVFVLTAEDLFSGGFVRLVVWSLVMVVLIQDLWVRRRKRRDLKARLAETEEELRRERLVVQYANDPDEAAAIRMYGRVSASDD